MAGGYSMSHLTVKWKENSTPPPPTHTFAGPHNTTWLDVVIFIWVSVFSLRFRTYLDEKFDRRGAKILQSPLLQTTGRPALAETSVKDPSCKSSSNKSIVKCVCPWSDIHK
jgi:hypothetical protein